VSKQHHTGHIKSCVAHEQWTQSKTVLVDSAC